jgi:hypothetical protein
LSKPSAKLFSKGGSAEQRKFNKILIFVIFPADIAFENNLTNYLKSLGKYSGNVEMSYMTFRCKRNVLDYFMLDYS